MSSVTAMRAHLAAMSKQLDDTTGWLQRAARQENGQVQSSLVGKGLYELVGPMGPRGRIYTPASRHLVKAIDEVPWDNPAIDTLRGRLETTKSLLMDAERIGYEPHRSRHLARDVAKMISRTQNAVRPIEDALDGAATLEQASARLARQDGRGLLSRIFG